MECVELAPAVGCVARFESGSKLHALHTLRAVWFRLCRPGDRRALPSAVNEALPPLNLSCGLHGGGRNHDGGGAGGEPRGCFIPSASSDAGSPSTRRMALAKNWATGTRSAARTLSIVSCGSKR